MFTVAPGIIDAHPTAVIQGVKLPALKQTLRVPRNFEIRVVSDNSIDDAMLPKKFGADLTLDRHNHPGSIFKRFRFFFAPRLSVHRRQIAQNRGHVGMIRS